MRTAVDRTFSGVSKDVAEKAEEEDVLSELDSGVPEVTDCEESFVASFSCQNQPIVLQHGYYKHTEDIL